MYYWDGTVLYFNISCSIKFLNSDMEVDGEISHFFPKVIHVIYPTLNVNHHMCHFKIFHLLLVTQLSGEQTEPHTYVYHQKVDRCSRVSFIKMFA